MAVFILVKITGSVAFESAPTPAFAQLPVSEETGNLEGKELRLGAGSARAVDGPPVGGQQQRRRTDARIDEEHARPGRDVQEHAHGAEYRCQPASDS